MTQKERQENEIRKGKKYGGKKNKIKKEKEIWKEMENVRKK